MTFTALTKDQRNLLARAVTKARTEAEAGAGAALVALAVDHHEPFKHMDDSARKLRNSLRAHGRQLGDALDTKRGTQEIVRLTHEVAFEHWHRMLFARFLAENDLLIHSDAGVAVSIDDCVDLAREQGKSPWELAASFAQSSLPAIFRKDDPALMVTLPAEHRTTIEKLVTDLPPEIFTGSDALGWVYQFWQAEKKEEVNAAGNKIGADELPAVTQLFTEDYMVDFLLDNTLGAWHAGKVLAANPKLAHSAESEDALRSAVSLPGCPWKYLRFIKDQDGTWKPAAGAFDGWPKTAKELKCLDPCMGSGHFVVAMFERMVALRLSAEHCTELEAVERVIRDNLFGLEIDPRCTQIAAFNLALAAWRRVGHCKLPAMNLACSGLAPNTREADWVAIAGSDSKLRNGMERLYRLFKDAPVLGSLINPRAGEGDLLVAAFHELQPLLEKALAQETKDDTAHEMAVTARGLAKAAEILAGQFTLVATNVPYLGRGNQDDVLKDYCERAHPEAKNDLATCFVERCLTFCAEDGSASLVTPQSWLFMGTYKELRSNLLTDIQWDFVTRLGTRAFETISGEVVNVALLGFTRTTPQERTSFAGIDVSDKATPGEKQMALISNGSLAFNQGDQRKNPDARIIFDEGSTAELLVKNAESVKGLTTGDGSRFIQFFWEQNQLHKGWEWFQTTVRSSIDFGGSQQIFLWEDGLGAMQGVPGARTYARGAWRSRGVLVCQMGSLPVTQYFGCAYDNNCAVIKPKRESDLPAFWAFCSSPVFTSEVRRIDQSLKPTNAAFEKIPFDLAHWRKVAAEKYPHGLPKPFSSDPTEWLFNGHPAGADQPLHVAVARLLGYQWPRQTGSSFPDCPALGPDGLETLADDDGIVPISPAKGEGPAAERLRELLARAYGKDWNATRQEALLAQVDYAGASLEDWLRNGFFEQHCALFHHRPFIWHVWDGLADGFHALVNYHSLAGPNGEGRRTLEKLTFAYLGDWIARQKAEQKAGKEGADGKLAAAVHLQDQLKMILDGEPPFDLFVRWKSLREQAIGWEPDINDGVRMNIRPFMMAETLNGKSIFRKAPKIKWEKDRGKEPERPKQDFPWFWSWGEENDDFMGHRTFDGNRWNDLHYSNAVKEASRAAHKGKKR